MKKNYLFCLFLALFSLPITAQTNEKNEDATTVRQIYDKALTQSSCYQWLSHLCTRIGGRLSGSPQAAQAVDYTKKMLDTLGLDKVWLQPCKVHHWVRSSNGKAEEVTIKGSKLIRKKLNVLAIGSSPTGDVIGEIVEVKSLEEVEKLGKEKIQGKIVFYNRAMDKTAINTFNAYGGAGDQRRAGPALASKLGAKGTLVRSLTTELDDFAHTGSGYWEEGITPIPTVAISTNDAEALSSALKKEPWLKAHIKTYCQTLPDADSYNVIGEIKGSEKPEEVIVVGGHLDSWDVAQGAHDDGAGVVQSMQVLELLKKIGYRPKRTIRCVLFMNEENGLAGGRAYAAYAAEKKDEKTVIAIESDAGGFTPRGFAFESEKEIFTEKSQKMATFLPLLEPFGLTMYPNAGSGADIGVLKNQKTFLIGFRPDSQRYFDFHHTKRDRIEFVNKRELELGAAAMTSLIYLMDKYGL